MDVVVHLAGDDADAYESAFRSVRTLLRDDGGDVGDVVVVAEGDAVSALLRGGGHDDAVADLVEAGVGLRACGNSMGDEGFSMENLLPGVERVSAGVTELVRLQDAGYAYVRP